jgi:hypothetical protein
MAENAVMGTTLVGKLRWAYEALKDMADEATQRISWFGLDPNLMDSPGEQICNLVPRLEGDFITDRELDLAADVQGVLLRLKDAIVEYQEEVGLDPDPRITIDHPKWRQIRDLARTALDRLFSQQGEFFERTEKTYGLTRVAVTSAPGGMRLYSEQDAAQLLHAAYQDGFGCLWLERYRQKDRGLQSIDYMIDDWTIEDIKLSQRDWLKISHEEAIAFLNSAPDDPGVIFWVFPWRF